MILHNYDIKTMTRLLSKMNLERILNYMHRSGWRWAFFEKIEYKDLVNTVFDLFEKVKYEFLKTKDEGVVTVATGGFDVYYFHTSKKLVVGFYRKNSKTEDGIEWFEKKSIRYVCK